MFSPEDIGVNVFTVDLVSVPLVMYRFSADAFRCDLVVGHINGAADGWQGGSEERLKGKWMFMKSDLYDVVWLA